MPGSPEFGYGAHISTNGGYQALALDHASQIGLDWVAIDFNWAQIWPDPSAQPNISAFLSLVQAARQRNLSIMVVLNHAPAWAMTPEGPDPEITASVILSLVKAFPNQLTAIELFPGANTTSSWGAPANPARYFTVYQLVQTNLANQNINTTIIPSIIPLASPQNPGDMNDLFFLKGLYETGAQFPIVGIRYLEVVGDPLSTPDSSTPNLLRHYELIRQSMLQNGQEKDRIWITGFAWPANITHPSNQAKWLKEAFNLLKAQLYIGTAFFAWLNPPGSDETWARSESLILEDASLHPAWQDLSVLASGNLDPEFTQNDNSLYQRLVKKLVKTINYKRPSP